MNPAFETMLKELQASENSAQARVVALNHIREMTPEEFTSLLEQLCELIRADESYRAARWWPALIAALVKDGRWPDEVAANSAHLLPQCWAALYTELGPECTSRGALLTLLIERGGSAELAIFTRLMTSDPPRGGTAASAPFGPLLHCDASAAAVLFPALLDGLSHPDVAPAILDLANHLTRAQVLGEHPAKARLPDLMALLRGLTGKLEALQRRIVSGSPPPQEQIETTIPLVIAICDALALIGDPSARSVLSDLLTVRHRRLRVESAAALARLGDEEGVHALLTLAAEPSVRLRVLAYAEELDLTSRLDEQWTSPRAIAEAELVACLAQSTHMGLPPTACELVDSRTLYWPGFEEPRMCYLFRYTYRTLGDDASASSYSNIGVAGPLAHCFRGDLGDLPVDDVYAAFAGWHAEHEEIQEIDVTGEPQQLDREERTAIARAQRELTEQGYQYVAVAQVGRFFGDLAVICTAHRGQTGGTVIVDPSACHWFPEHRTAHPLTPAETYCIYKGRRLLAAFND